MTQKDATARWWIALALSGLVVFGLVNVRQAMQIQELGQRMGDQSIAISNVASSVVEAERRIRELHTGLSENGMDHLRFEREVFLRYADVVKQCRGVEADLGRLRSEVRSHRALF